jgi:hypothetical protein
MLGVRDPPLLVYEDVNLVERRGPGETTSVGDPSIVSNHRWPTPRLCSGVANESSLLAFCRILAEATGIFVGEGDPLEPAGDREPMLAEPFGVEGGNGKADLKLVTRL